MARPSLRPLGLFRAAQRQSSLVTWLLALAFLCQAQVLGSHFHALEADRADHAIAAQDDHAPADPRKDLPCVVCQQLASVHHALAAGAPGLVAPDTTFDTPSRANRGPAVAHGAAFAWSSRAPPVA